LRGKAARDHRQLNELQTMVDQHEKQKVGVESGLRETSDLLQRTRQETEALEARLRDLTTTLEQQDKQLTHSISISQLNEAGGCRYEAVAGAACDGPACGPLRNV
jgi:predicted  nucleic acid-binding Zn-ribbon protein